MPKDSQPKINCFTRTHAYTRRPDDYDMRSEREIEQNEITITITIYFSDLFLDECR